MSTRTPSDTDSGLVDIESFSLKPVQASKRLATPESKSDLHGPMTPFRPNRTLTYGNKRVLIGPTEEPVVRVSRDQDEIEDHFYGFSEAKITKRGLWRLPSKYFTSCDWGDDMSSHFAHDTEDEDAPTPPNAKLYVVVPVKKSGRIEPGNGGWLLTKPQRELMLEHGVPKLFRKLYPGESPR